MLGAIDWMSVFPANPYIEILTTNVMALGRGAFGRWLGHKEGVLMNEISDFVKETPKSSLPPFTMWRQSEKKSVCISEQAPQWNPNTLAPWS